MSTYWLRQKSSFLYNRNYMYNNVAIKTTDYTLLWKYMNDSTFLDKMGKWMIDPADYILSLTVFPFPIKTGTHYGYLECCGVSARNMTQDKHITCKSLPDINSGIELLCSEQITRKYNNFMDYSQYTKLSIYLPYFGIEELNIDDFIDTNGKSKYLSVILVYDYATGNANYYICSSTNKINSIYNDGEYNIYDTSVSRIVKIIQFQLGESMPLTKNNFGGTVDNLTKQVIGTGIKLIGTAVTGVPTATFSGSSTTTETKKEGRRKAYTKTKESSYNSTKTYNDERFERATNVIGSSMNSLHSLGSSNSTYSSNNLSINSHQSTNIKLIYKRPKVLETNETYSKLYGKPCGKTSKLKDLRGFTKINKIHLDGLENATSSEIESIEALLYNGVIL